MGRDREDVGIGRIRGAVSEAVVGAACDRFVSGVPVSAPVQRWDVGVALAVRLS